MRHVTDGGFDPTQSIAAQVAPLLALFADGEYGLSFGSVDANCLVIDFNECADPFDRLDHFYPSDPTLVTTRPRSSLDPERVKYYRPRIRSGIRPVLLTVDIAYSELVLDGHHKLAAYRELGSPPALLSSTRLEPKQLTPEVARHAFVDAPSFYDGYLALKRENDDP